MDRLQQCLTLGRELGLEGDGLIKFAQEQQALEREERRVERGEKQKAFERQEQDKAIEREHEERERERAHALEMKEYELKIAESRQNTQSTDSNDTVRTIPKLPKLPQFRDRFDDLDAYLLRFERFATSCGWLESNWALSLSALLTGRALEIYSRLPVATATDYEQLKSALLQSYQLTEGGYRDKFRIAKPSADETYVQFAERLNGYITRWMELAKIEKTFEGVIELLVREQLLASCNKELAIFLRERKPHSLSELTFLADQYALAHFRSSQTSNGNRPNNRSYNPNQNRGRGNTEQNHGDRSYRGGSNRGGRGNNNNRDNRFTVGQNFSGCFVCGNKSHLAKDCNRKFEGVPRDRLGGLEQDNTIATSPELAHNKDRPLGACVDIKLCRPTCFPSNGSYVKLACGHEIPLASAACNAGQGMPVLKGLIGNTEVEVLRDTGCSAVVVQEALINEKQLQGVKRRCALMDGTVREFPVAVINSLVDSDIPVVASRAELIKAQKEDSTLQKVRKLADESEIRLTGKANEIKFLVKENLLFREFKSERPGNLKIVTKQLVVPTKFRNQILTVAHDSPMAGHLGTKKTIDRIQAYFYWPGLQADVKRYCASCDICQRTFPKGKVQRVPLDKMPLIDTPFRRIAVDLVGPISPVSERGNRYILTIVDFATRYPEAVALPRIESERVAEALVEVCDKTQYHKDDAEVASSTVCLETLGAGVIEVDSETDQDAIIELPLEQKESVKDVNVGDCLKDIERKKVNKLLNEYTDVLTDLPGKTDLLEYAVTLTTDDPVRSRPYPAPHALRETIKSELDAMLRMGVIEPSTSKYASPIVMVRKKDNSNRFCVDYRKLNSVTLVDPEPIPNIEDLMSRISAGRYFSKLDLTKGYWQIPVTECDKDKTAFVTTEGLYQFTVLPFGMVNAPAAFTRMMRRLLNGLDHVINYIDDILIFTNDFAQHEKALRNVLERLRKAGLTARPSKCSVAYKSLQFLGHIVGEGLVKPLPEKVQAVMVASQPTTKKEVRSFLGLVGYYNKFIPNFSAIAAPMSDLTKKGQPNKVKWGVAQEVSFKVLKQRLANAPILHLPDPSLAYILRTDASDKGIGALLMQDIEGCKFPIAFASKKLLPREEKFSVIEKECLALVWAVKRFHVYLYGKQFTIETDHHPLAYITKAKMNNNRVMRWALDLQPYRYVVHVIKGSENFGADFLSRCVANDE
ncbi:hypothetical protein BSL78_21861 [Apostichopus japonicus]|uniref:Reverse transcriptase n=1 Tax=Stichopus japonicus TaxID=307972 RepID=A0A2G8JZX8_STIJA|nr:hypothetical protein BSL78_21861 [Apostichopus japonicus]